MWKLVVREGGKVLTGRVTPVSFSSTHSSTPPSTLFTRRPLSNISQAAIFRSLGYKDILFCGDLSQGKVLWQDATRGVSQQKDKQEKSWHCVVWNRKKEEGQKTMEESTLDPEEVNYELNPYLHLVAGGGGDWLPHYSLDTKRDFWDLGPFRYLIKVSWMMSWQVLSLFFGTLHRQNFES